MTQTQPISQFPSAVIGNIIKIQSALKKQSMDVDSMQLILQIMANTKKSKQQFLEELLVAIKPIREIVSQTARFKINKPSHNDGHLHSYSSQSASLSKVDQQWLAKVEELVADHLVEYEFTLDRLSQLIFLSPRQIRRRLLRMTGLTFSQYLKKARFEMAFNLLQMNKVKSVKALAHKIGFRDVKYFSRQFKLCFGQSPSIYFAVK